jgi:hypothetical protein
MDIQHTPQEAQNRDKRIRYLNSVYQSTVAKHKAEIEELKKILERERSYSNYLYNTPTRQLLKRALNQICNPIINLFRRPSWTDRDQVSEE